MRHMLSKQYDLLLVSVIDEFRIQLNIHSDQIPVQYRSHLISCSW